MSHLTQEQRYTIEVLNNEKFSQTAIAAKINKHKSVVCRELKRNKDMRNGLYKAVLAQKKCESRHKEKHKNVVFDKAMKSYVNHWIKEDYSPVQIVGRSKKEGLVCVSHERIYQHIWRDKKQNGDLYLHLRNGRKRYRKRGAKKDKRGQIPNKISIKERPKEVEERLHFGDFEVDLIVGKNHKKALVTANDRATGMFRMKRNRQQRGTKCRKSNCRNVTRFGCKNSNFGQWKGVCKPSKYCKPIAYKLLFCRRL